MAIASGTTLNVLERGPGLWLYCRGRARIGHDVLRKRLEANEPQLISHDFGPVTSISGTSVPVRPAFELVLGGFTFEATLIRTSRDHGSSVYHPDHDLHGGGHHPHTSALVLAPGPHLAGAEGTLLVVRALWTLGARLAELNPEVSMVGWPPSGTLMLPKDFISAAQVWGKGGAVPNPGVIAFRPAMGGALQSSGLALFTGQDVRLEPDFARDPDHALRMGHRIAEMLLHRGPLEQTEQFTGPSGEAIRMEPSANRRFVRVWPG